MSKIDVEKVDSVKLYKIRKTLDELSDKTGHGTELISVYIPKGKQLHEVIGTLREEQGTADNIKSDFTRSHVVDSLGKVIQRLKLYKKTPDKGLVVFCGALPPEGGGPIGSETVTIFEIEPPKDLKQYLYRCDDHFHVDILKDMLKDDNLIGFLASWSAVRELIKEQGEAAFDNQAKKLEQAWGKKRPKKIRWPLHFRIGKVK